MLLWKDIRVSGIAFSAGTFLYFLLEWSGYSLLTLLANTALAGLALAFLWNTVARFTGKCVGPLQQLTDQSIHCLLVCLLGLGDPSDFCRPL